MEERKQGMTGQEHYDAAMAGLEVLDEAIKARACTVEDRDTAVSLAQLHMLAYVGKALEDVALGLGVPPLRTVVVDAPVTEGV